LFEALSDPRSGISFFEFATNAPTIGLDFGWKNIDLVWTTTEKKRIELGSISTMRASHIMDSLERSLLSAIDIPLATLLLMRQNQRSKYTLLHLKKVHFAKR
jgi:hypothetical protein